MVSNLPELLEASLDGTYQYSFVASASVKVRNFRTKGLYKANRMSSERGCS